MPSQDDKDHGSDATLPAAATAPAEPRLLEVPRSHYDVGSELARGGMGRILIARDVRLDRRVALKELLKGDEGLAVRFEREARVTGRLQHPAIVPVYEAGRWPSGEPFYAMKLVTGRSLDEVIADTETLDQRMALLPNVISIVEAIAYAHGEGVIHRDLKPANVLVGAFGETVVIDWGLAKDVQAVEVPASPYRGAPGDAEASLTVVGAVMGTPAYMAPEQAAGDPVDARADVYALGAILYHALAGHAPYRGTSGTDVLQQVKEGPPRPLPSLQPDVAEELSSIVATAMARDPGRRYPTARELAEELQRFQTGKLVSSHRYTTWALVRRWLRRHRAAVTAAAALLVTGAIVAAVSLRQIIQARDAAEEERRAFLEERGRQELLAGHPTRALVYLTAAEPGAQASPALRLLLAEAARPLDGQLFATELGDTATNALLSLDGKRAALVLRAGGVWVLDATSGVLVSSLARPPGRVAALRFSAGGQLLLVGGGDGTAGIWDTNSGARRVELAARVAGVRAVAFSPDDTRVALAFADGTVTLHAAATGAALSTLTAPGAPDLSSLELAADGAVRAAGDTGLLTWPAGGGAPTLLPVPGLVAASSDGSRVLATVAAEDHADQLVLRDPHADDPLAELGARPAAAFFAAAADRFVTVGDTVAVWGADGTRPIAEVERGAGAVAISPDGTRVATSAADGTISVSDAATGTLLLRLGGHTRRATTLVFTSDGQRLLSASADGSARLWRTDPVPVRLIELGTSAPPLAADGDALAWMDPEGAVAVGEPLAAVPAARVVAPGIAVRSLALAPGGGALVTVDDDNVTRVWELPSGKAVRSLPGIAFGAVAGTRGRVAVNQGPEAAVFGPDGKLLAQLRGHTDLIGPMGLAPDGDLVVTGARDGGARLWDGGSGAVRAALGAHASAVGVAGFSPTGDRFAIAAGDGSVEVWDARGPALTSTLAGHGGRVTTVDFGAEGRVLTASERGARVWDGVTGRLLLSLDADTGPEVGPIAAAVLGADGRFIYTAGAHAVVWDAVKGVPLVSVPLPGSASELHVGPRGDWLAVRVGATLIVRRLALETRDAPALAPLVARAPVRLAEGRLVTTVAGADESEPTAGERVKVYDFDEDVIETQPVAPGLTTDVALYREGWARAQAGDTSGAFERLASAARNWGDRPGAAQLRAELLRFGAEAGAEPERVMLEARPIAEPGPALAREVAAAYAAAADNVRADRVWVALAARSPELAAEVALERIRLAGDPLAAADRAVEAVQAALAPATPAETAAEAFTAVAELAVRDQVTYRKTFDVRYYMAAKRIDRAYATAPGRPDTARLAKLDADLDRAFAARGDPRVQVTGGIDKATIRTALRARTARLARCADVVRRREPAAAGVVRVQLQLSSGGTVADVITQPPGGTKSLGAIAACVADEVRHLQFPHVASGEKIIVAYPLLFR